MEVEALYERLQGSMVTSAELSREFQRASHLLTPAAATKGGGRSRASSRAEQGAVEAGLVSPVPWVVEELEDDSGGEVRAVPSLPFFLKKFISCYLRRRCEACSLHWRGRSRPCRSKRRRGGTMCRLYCKRRSSRRTIRN